jgi:hypothetical protein
LTNAAVVLLAFGAIFASRRASRLEARIRALEPAPPKREYTAQEYWDMYVENTGNPYNLKQGDVEAWVARTAERKESE